MIDLETLRQLIRAYQVPVVAQETGLSRQTIHNFVKGGNPSLATVNLLVGFIESHQILARQLYI